MFWVVMGFIFFFLFSFYIPEFCCLTAARTNWNLPDAYVGILLSPPVVYIPASDDF